MTTDQPLLAYIYKKAQTGVEIIEASRAVLYFLVDSDQDDLEVFASIDSQTDHIDLGPNSAFRFPSPRARSCHIDDLKAILPGQRRAIASSVNSIISPNDKIFDLEIQSIFNAFGDIFEKERMALLDKCHRSIEDGEQFDLLGK